MEVIQVGGDDVDAAITSYVRTTMGLQIEPRTAERIKIELGEDPVMSIKGRSLKTGKPMGDDVVMREVQVVALAAMEPLFGCLDGHLQRWGGTAVRVHPHGGGALLAGLAARVGETRIRAVRSNA